MSNKSKRLLEKYDVLLEHLDFDYIGKSVNASEVEKIVKILRSGQEGHFPELTSFAERRLLALKPTSKLFRKETPLGTKGSVPRDRWNELSADLAKWECEMQKLHSDLLEDKGSRQDSQIPPIRSTCGGRRDETDGTRKIDTAHRIKSCDYENWDRFDAEAEILKMDLAEERHKEFVQTQNAKNAQMGCIIEELEPNEADHLSEREKQVMAAKLREKGNDFFRSKEFQLALREYNRSIELSATAACFNNRAIAYIKLMLFKEAILDCDACLQLEPDNLKALTRKAQALMSCDKRREGYEVYSQILRLDPHNKLALNAVDELRRQLPDLPPPNAVQFKIQEVANEYGSDTNDDDDYAALIKPKKILKDKLPDAVKSLKKETAKMVRETMATSRAETDRVEILPRATTKRPIIEEL